MKAEHTIETPNSRKKKRLPILSSLVSVAVIVTLLIIWKQSSNDQKSIVSNRVTASKIVKLGIPLPENFEQKVDLQLLEADANSGNQISQEILKLYQHRKSANDALELGKPAPDKLPDRFDIGLLEEDANAGNANAMLQLELLNQRRILTDNIKLGKEFPAKALNQLDQELLKRDASAGNSEVGVALALLDTRNTAAALCVLGKPFKLDFYDHVDRDLLKQDADAGYPPSIKILKLAETRIKAEELTVQFIPYPADFLEQLDGDLLRADADAGNADMQYIWARFHDLHGPNKDEAVIKKYYTLSAEQGNPKAQCNLGAYYLTTKGADQSYSKAEKFFMLSANTGYHLAERNLAILILEGYASIEDNEKGVEWLTKAAVGEDGFAQNLLGAAYCFGYYGLEVNLQLGTDWLKKAIDKGVVREIHKYHNSIEKIYPRGKQKKLIREALLKGIEKEDPYSMAWYGDLVLHGDGVKQDTAEGLKWIKKAVDSGHPEGLYFLGRRYQQGAKGLKPDMSKAAEIFKKLAENKKKDERAIEWLCGIYYSGKGNVKKDYKLAVKYLQMHIDLGFTDKLSWLACMYRDGEGVEVDIEKAIQLLEKAANHNEPLALIHLGNIYASDDYGKKDTEKAIQYYKKGVDLGEPYSQTALADIYLKGKYGVPQNIPAAVKLLRTAAKKNSRHAKYELGEIYENGQPGIEINLKEAIEFYKASAKQRYKPAQEALKRLKVE